MVTESSNQPAGAAGFNIDEFLLSHPAAPVEPDEQTEEFRVFIEFLGREFRARTKDELFLGKKWIFVRSVSSPGESFVTALGTRAKNCCLLANLVTEELILVSEAQALEAYDFYRALDRRPKRKGKYARYQKLPTVGLYSALSPSLQPLLKAQSAGPDPFTRLPCRTDQDLVNADPLAPPTKKEEYDRAIMLKRAANQLQRLKRKSALDVQDIADSVKQDQEHIISYGRKWAPLMYM